MDEIKPETDWPTPEEDAAINAGIASDPDTSELDEEWFKRARPAGEVDPALVEEYKRTRGKPALPTRAVAEIKIDSDLYKRLRQEGDDWQERINQILRIAILGRRVAEEREKLQQERAELRAKIEKELRADGS